MTERRTGSGGTENNVRDELDEAADRGKDATGGVKDNVEDEWDESQER
jgi:hypothetical protein